MNLEEYKKQFEEEDPVGWDCIDTELAKIYSEQEPSHFIPAPHFIAGGEDPLDGISVYKSDKQTKHLHFVTYGFSELYYNEESVGEEFSLYGFELTFRLKVENENEEVNWVYTLLQNLARYVFSSGKWFDKFHLIPISGSIRSGLDTEIAALAFVPDPELGEIETPHGKVMFLQMVALTATEYEELKKDPINRTEKFIEKRKHSNELLITDLKQMS